MKTTTASFLFVLAAAASAAELHVAITGNDSNPGTPASPFRTIQHAADLAQPGDTVTVHAGTYRERVDPPRGGISETQRITYQAAAGETVVISGSEPATGWERVAGDTWKLVIPSKDFGNFNPYSDRIRGDWFNGKGRVHHTGCVYLDGQWMIEAATLAEVNAAPGTTPLWFATVDGDDDRILANLASIKVGNGKSISGGEPSFRYGGKSAPCSEGGTCSGWNSNGFWLRFDDVDFGSGATQVELRTAAPQGDTVIEFRLGHPQGERLGACKVTATGDWQKWQTFTAPIKSLAGKHSLCLVFKSPEVDQGMTTIYAQFPGGLNPNQSNVEINRRQTVFYPSRNYINFLTVRGFTLQHAATNWAPPSSEQTGVIGTNWSKGWIIENNLVQFSKCAGIALGKYGDGTDNTNDAGQADPYTACVRRALKNGWNKATIGSHIVRNNHIRHCEQTGVVGSMGCAFSTVTGNEIHDIHVRRLFTGAEMGGIKFHAAVDAEISNNHIYRCGGVAGLWLDWMAQGTRVIGNLMHDNDSAGDIFLEVNHGPFLLANNLLLSRKTIDSMSNGGAYVHNLTAGSFVLHPEPRRNTPTLVPHGTEIANLLATQVGDDRWFNNIIANSGNLAGYDAAPLPVFMGGNVFLNGGKPSKHEANPSVAASPVAVKFTRDSDGTCWLELPADPAWSASPRKLVTTELLGKAALPGQAYEMPDGAPLAVDSDYFGKPRNKQNPTPGPIEMTGGSPQKFKVWPK